MEMEVRESQSICFWFPFLEFGSLGACDVIECWLEGL